MVKYSKDGKVKFDSISHTYYLGERKLQGVTTFISKYKNPFDSALIAKKYVKKHGGNVEDLLLQWKQKSDISKRNGTGVHDLFEKYIETGIITVTGNYPKEDSAVKFIHDYFFTKKLIPVEVETVIYDENTGLASMVDCIAKNIAGDYFILDWKTNSKVERNSYGKYMLSPFDHLPDSNYYHYSLQLSIYKKMVNDYSISGIFIVHITDNGYDILKANEDKTSLDSIF